VKPWLIALQAFFIVAHLVLLWAVNAQVETLRRLVRIVRKRNGPPAHAVEPEWQRCPTCGCIAREESERYLRWLETGKTGP
jgi:hypothetical protein